LFFQLQTPGVTWDEGHPNFPAAKNQAEWLRNIVSWDAPFSKETIGKYWFTTSDHPSLPRTIAAVSYLLFSPPLDEITALRIPSALQFSLLITTIYLFLRLFVPVSGAIAGSVSLVLMPRVFGHAHLFSLDIPIMCWWFWTAIIGYLVFQGQCKPIWFGLAYAVTFTTKLHAVFLPFPFLLWIGLQIYFNKEKRSFFIQRSLRAAGWVIVLTPILYIGLQPWLWHDTWVRIAERFFDYAEKSTARPIPVFYFKQVFGNNTPWHYPLVMFSITVPVSIFILFLAGIFSPLLNKITATTHNVLQKIDQQKEVLLLIVFLFITPLLLVLLPLAQAYDGCRLFLPCFPFAALLAGFSYSAISRYLCLWYNTKILHSILYVLIFAFPLYSLIHVYPFYLAYYNGFVGGIRGAKEKGFETVYWGDALTKDFLDQVNQTVPEGKTVHPKSTSHGVIDYYIERGWLKKNFKDYPWDYALLQSRQGMFTREEWTFYLRRRPLIVQGIDGVPLYTLYGPLE